MPVDEKPVAFDPIFQFRELDISAPRRRLWSPELLRLRLEAQGSVSWVFLHPAATWCWKPCCAWCQFGPKLMVESPPVALQRLHVSMNYGDQGSIRILWAMGSGSLYLAGRSFNMALMLACGKHRHRLLQGWSAFTETIRDGSYFTQKFAVVPAKEKSRWSRVFGVSIGLSVDYSAVAKTKLLVLLAHNHHDHHESGLDACDRMGEPSMQWIC